MELIEAESRQMSGCTQNLMHGGRLNPLLREYLRLESKIRRIHSIPWSLEQGSRDQLSQLHEDVLHTVGRYPCARCSLSLSTRKKGFVYLGLSGLLQRFGSRVWMVELGTDP